MGVLLETQNLDGFYGEVQVLRNVNVSINTGDIVTIVGANGAGKTTLANAISNTGEVKLRQGQIIFEGCNITHADPAEIVEQGIIQVPEGRRLFPFLTVTDNLRLGAFNRRANKTWTNSLDMVYSIFPILKTRSSQLAGLLSGGEQQMCAIGRGLMAKPKLLILDEPSLGLAPLIVKEVFRIIQDLKREGITIMLIEQNVKRALEISDYGFVLEQGNVVMANHATGLKGNPDLKKAYLGA